MQSIRRIFTPVDGNVLRFTFFFWAKVEDKPSERDSDCTVHRPEHTNMHTEVLYNKTLWKNVPISYFSLLLFCSLLFSSYFPGRGLQTSISVSSSSLSLSLSFTCCTVFSLARPLCGSHCYSHSSLAHTTSLSLSRSLTHTLSLSLFRSANVCVN